MFVRFHRAPVLTAAGDSIFDLEREIGNIFNGVFGSGAQSAEQGPALDIAEQEDASVVVAELPGVKREDIKITLHDGMLTLAAERKQTALPENAQWIRNEIPAGRVTRTVTLPHDVEADRVSAELTNGILRIVLPKAASARPKEIQVQ
jgi:HSP20 family protein